MDLKQTYERIIALLQRELELLTELDRVMATEDLTFIEVAEERTDNAREIRQLTERIDGLSLGGYLPGGSR